MKDNIDLIEILDKVEIALKNALITNDNKDDIDLFETMKALLQTHLSSNDYLASSDYLLAKVYRLFLKSRNL